MASKGVEIESMSQIHKFKVEPIGNSPERAKVLIDDIPIRCSEYSIQHFAGELPKIEVAIQAVPEYEHDGEITITNKGQIAQIMSKKEFKEFCRIWEDLHNG